MLQQQQDYVLHVPCIETTILQPQVPGELLWSWPSMRLLFMQRLSTLLHLPF